MKKITFAILFLLFLSEAFGQTKQENKWIIGTWKNPSGNITIVFNDNGSGRVTNNNNVSPFNFSIIQNSAGPYLYLFYESGKVEAYLFHRINDQYMILDGNPVVLMSSNPYTANNDLTHWRK